MRFTISRMPIEGHPIDTTDEAAVHSLFFDSLVFLSQLYKIIIVNVMVVLRAK